MQHGSSTHIAHMVRIFFLNSICKAIQNKSVILNKEMPSFLSSCRRSDHIANKERHGEQFPSTKPRQINLSKKKKNWLSVLQNPRRTFQLIELENKWIYGQLFSPFPEREKVQTCEENNMATLRAVKEVGRGTPNVGAEILLQAVVRAITQQAIAL